MNSKKVASHLICPLCSKLYKKAKCLPCYHSYCENCLVTLQKASSDSITCPECRKTSALPSGGIKQLPNNFFINRIVDEVVLKEKITGEKEVHCDLCIREYTAVVLCIDCVVFLCSHCHEFHKYSREYQGHRMSQLKELRSNKKDINVRPKAKPLLCQEHEVELNLYCGTCEQLVCQYCIKKEHNGHEHNTVKRMAKKHRGEMDGIIEPVDEMIKGLARAHQNITNTRKSIQMQATEVDQQIDDYYDQLHLQLQQQREELKKELHEVSAQKKNTLSLQLEQMKHVQVHLKTTKELNCAIKSGSDQEMLFMKKQVAENMKRMTYCYKKLKTEPAEVANMQFIPVEEHQKLFPQFASISDDDVAPVNCVAEGIPSFAFINRNIEFKVATKTVEGLPCSKGGSEVTAQVWSCNKGGITPVAVKDNKDGSYLASLTFRANQIGDVKLKVIVNGRHVKGSPFNVTVHRNYLALNGPDKIINDGAAMGEPWGVAFGKDGMWAVTDHSNHCVYIFDSQDQVVRKFGSQGNGNGEFNSPAGIAFDDDNNLYVVCRYNDRVQKFDVTGKYLLKFGSKGCGKGQLNCPLGITVHDKKVYVADQVNYRVSVFHCNGEISLIIGLSMLSAVCDVAMNNNNQLLVADKGNHCVSIFTLNGNYVGKIGAFGVDKGQLHCPSAIAVDKDGFILVIEDGNHHVSIFDKDCNFIRWFDCRGSANGQFSTPHKVALSPDGSIYISDYSNKRILVFSDF